MTDDTPAGPAVARRPRLARVRRWATRTWTGRAVALALAVKALVGLTALAGLTPGWLETCDTLASVVLIVGAGMAVVQAWPRARRQLLWRVRRKLTLSYVFIGLVPALLIVTFFAIAGLILLSSVSAYILEQHVRALVADARAEARMAAVALETAGAGANVPALLARRQAGAAAAHPGASLVVVAAPPACGVAGAGASGAEVPRAGQPLATAGPWAHAPVPAVVPGWVPCDGYAGVTTYLESGRPLAAEARAVAPIAGAGPRRVVVVDLPIGDALARAVRADAGLTLEVLASREQVEADRGTAGAERRLRFGTVSFPIEGAARGLLQFVAFLDFADWLTGEPRTLIASFTMSPLAVYRRISGPGLAQAGDFSFGQILLLALGAVGVLFLLIQGVAIAMGFVLARSITGAVHELFVGTERVRRGDFTHPVAVTSEDQLGELAASFNAMTASIDDLLAQKAEKERMEQELRIARDIQMSLLPQGPLAIPGLQLEAYCEPAREVGGDYYDVLPLDAHRFAVLIADVAGKGTSAALYMAELKGIVLSLSQSHHSPRQILVDANRIVSRHLDSRSFITMLYGVVDVRAGTFTYARAGHCPLIHVPGAGADREPRVLAPGGLVLGLQIDDGQTFERLLEEATIQIGPGDVVLLFTDGLSEAMNAEGDCFGETRLGALVAAQADTPFEGLGRRILDEVRAFAAHTAQQDDMTMVMLRVDRTGVAGHGAA